MPGGVGLGVDPGVRMGGVAGDAADALGDAVVGEERGEVEERPGEGVQLVDQAVAADPAAMVACSTGQTLPRW